MKNNVHIIFVLILTIAIVSCTSTSQKKIEKTQEIEQKEITAADILGNPEYLAMSYGGYRELSRDVQPTIVQLKEDMKILAAMGVKIVRTYNVHFDQAANLLKAIKQLKEEDESFEMYVMLGAWIDCENAFSPNLTPNHNAESPRNATEIETAVKLANQYPNIVKVLAVGNEAMVHWAASYYVQPSVILKWVNHLQNLKAESKLPKDLWVTSSDDFASWGGGDTNYHTEDLENLIKAVDYISMHTYPMHNTYYNPAFWVVPETEMQLTEQEKIDAAIERAVKFAQNQYQAVTNYMKSLGVNKPVHIGESGWATASNNHYGTEASKAADEYKAGEYYKKMRKWTNENNISLFYFEAFDEQWKDAQNPLGSENHFGLINLEGKAKYAIWDLVNEGVFDGLTRDGKSITKSYNGKVENLMENVLVPPSYKEIDNIQK